MTPEHEECAGNKKEDLIEKFQLFVSYYSYRFQDIDRFVKFILWLKSGFICTICDMFLNKYIHNYYNLKLVVSHKSCNEVYREKIRFSHVEIDVYNLSRVVNGLSCSIKK